MPNKSYDLAQIQTVARAFASPKNTANDLAVTGTFKRLKHILHRLELRGAEDIATPVGGVVDSMMRLYAECEGGSQVTVAEIKNIAERFTPTELEFLKAQPVDFPESLMGDATHPENRTIFSEAKAEELVVRYLKIYCKPLNSPLQALPPPKPK